MTLQTREKLGLSRYTVKVFTPKDGESFHPGGCNAAPTFPGPV